MKDLHSAPLLAVEGLTVAFGATQVIEDLSFSVAQGRTLAIVGESGSGKSVTSLSIMRLADLNGARFVSGRIVLDQAGGPTDLLTLDQEEARKIRGKEIAMIFQEPMTSLNPTRTIGWQLSEAMTVHGKDAPAARTRALELLERVGLRDPNAALRQYPHELSGGMRQRVMSAIALANRPKLLISDEPTTALDVTVQAQIMSLIKELQDELGMAMLLITHDLGIVSEVAHDVSVMYAGQVVEAAPTRDLFHDPRHPYTQGLFASLPARNRRGQDLMTLDGIVPDAANWPTGCRFAERCVHRLDACSAAAQLRVSASGRQVRCHLPSAMEVTK